MWNILEQPWTLTVIAALVLLVMLFFRGELAEKRRRLWFLVPFVLVGLAFGLDYLVATDQEKIKESVKKVVRATEEEDVEAIIPLIADEYSDSFHRTKSRLIANCRFHLDRPTIDKNVLRITSVEVHSDTATVEFSVRVVFDPQHYIYQYQKMMPFKLRAELREQGGRWLFTRVEVTEVNLRPASWRDVQAGASGL